MKAIFAYTQKSFFLWSERGIADKKEKIADKNVRNADKKGKVADKMLEIAARNPQMKKSLLSMKKKGF